MKSFKYDDRAIDLLFKFGVVVWSFVLLGIGGFLLWIVYRIVIHFT